MSPHLWRLMITSGAARVHERKIALSRHTVNNGLNSFRRLLCSSDGTLNDRDKGLSRTRNIGIIAHIDAGKTTTTERMLYYSGLTEAMGEVHDGDTVTDYLPQERERGITVTSACVTFPWKKHRFNLLDTPGHVDFTVEVERSLSVLDGAVVVLDASAGVEAQTLTVWSQADRYSLPRVVYLNKMDKSTADVEMCLKSIRKISAITPFLVHLPLKLKQNFIGVIDVISLEKVIWDKKAADGSSFTAIPLSPNNEEDKPFYEKASMLREEAVGLLSEGDKQLSEAILNCDRIQDVPSNTIHNALRRATITQRALPILCGSSYKKVGVQLLMDAVLKYLPSPVEKRKDLVNYYGDNLCALAFKVVHDKNLGVLTFIRVYSGEIKSPTKLYVVNRDKHEKANKLYAVYANQFKEQPSVSRGNIAVVTGLQHCVTGDTLVTSSDIANKVRKRYSEEQGLPPEECPPVLAGIKVPDPVFFCSIEAPSVSKQKTLEKALECLQREDPSLKVTVNEESGQMTVSGMGELHIDIIKDRILKEYGVEAYLGPLQVSYRETIDRKVEETIDVNKVIGGTKNVVKMRLIVKPEPGASKPKLKVVVTKDNNLGKLRFDHLKAIENGVDITLSHGPLLSFPVIDVALELLLFETTYGTTQAMIASAAAHCLATALNKSNPVLLEPVMKLEIATPDGYVGRIMSDLSTRRSQFGDMSERGSLRVLHAITPLSELVNYSTSLRTLSSGTASLAMEFLCYHRMNEVEQKRAVEQVTGFA